MQILLLLPFEYMKSLQKEFDKSRAKFSVIHKIPICITEMHLGVLKRAFETRFKKTIKQERKKDKKPATIAYDHFIKWGKEEQDAFIIEMAIHAKVDEIVRKDIKKLKI